MIGRRAAAALLAVLVVASTAAVPVAAAMTQSSVNHDADLAQNPRVLVDVTVATHDRATMDSPLAYEDDQGDLAMLPASVNRSSDVDDLGMGTVNPMHFYATDVHFDDAYAFPHDNANSWSNAGDWSTTSNVTATNTTTAPDVDAVEVAATPATSASETVTATFSENVSVTSDVNKRYLAAAIDVRSVDAGASVYLRAVESDGDYKQVTLVNTSESAANDTVAAKATTEGAVVQQQLGSLSVMGSGDGTLAAVDSIEVVAMGGNATVAIQMLNAEKIGEYQYGEKRVDTDDEDDLETKTITEPSGEIWIGSLDSMGDAFGAAEIKGLTFPATFAAADLSDDADVNVTTRTAEGYPSFQKLAIQQYRIELPSAYDLSYANAMVVDDVSAPTTRYQQAGLVEGAGDTNFSDLSYTSFRSTVTDATRGETVTIDDTIQPGQELAIRYESLATDQEATMLLDTQAGAAVMTDGGDDGLLGGAWDFISGGLLGLLGLFGLRKGGARILGGSGS